MKRTVLVFFACCLATFIYASGRHTTIIISLDGCRWDYPYLYHTPMLDYMANHGIESGLIPSFPSKTFPNHYTIATGLYPDHHGIVANTFLDTESGNVFNLSDPEQKYNPVYYGGEPVWITARRNNIKTAVFYWPGSDVKIQGQSPDLFYYYDEEPRLTFSQRIDGILAELEKPFDVRPQLIMAYFEQPDANGHTYGPHSEKTRQAVMEMDSLVQCLYDGLCRSGMEKTTNLVVLSDHGMTWVDKTHAVPLMPCLKKEWVWDIQGNIPACIYANDGCADSIYHALKDLDHVKVWRKHEVPEYLHYGTSSHIGDVVVLPDIGYVAYDKPIEAGGTHGYDPTLQDMHAVFRAIGPDIPRCSLPHFPNVCVYSLICKLLDIEPAPNDGKIPF